MSLLIANTPPAIFSYASMVSQAENGEGGGRGEAGEKGESNDSGADLKSILKIEDAAEMTAGGELSGVAAAKACTQAAKDWPGVRSMLMQNRASSVQLARVDLAIANLKGSLAKNADLRRSANELTGALAPLFKNAGDKVPSPIHSLDYLGRSITLDVQTHDWVRAARDSESLATTWAQVRAQVQARHGGATAAAHFSRTQHEIAQAVRSHDSVAALSATRDSGSAVDQLEKVY